MAVTVDQMNISLRLDDTDKADDEMMQRYIDAAGEYVRRAVDGTVAVDAFEQYSQYDIAVGMLTEFWYQIRGDFEHADTAIPYGVTSMIQQLRGIFAADL